MAMSTVCQTPGAQYQTLITDQKIIMSIEFGRMLNLSEAEAVLLEANAHNALEMVLAKYYVPAGNPETIF